MTTPHAVAAPVAGYAAWYDASAASSIHASSGSVDQWDDLSGNARNLTAALTVRPTTGTRTQNGLNVLDLDGSNDTMAATGFTLTQPNTMFVVALNDGGANGTAQSIASSAATTAAALIKTAANLWGLNAGTALTGGTPDTAAHVHTGVFNGASSGRWVDGSSVASGNGGSGALTGLRVGAQFQTVNFWDGWVAEFIVYNSALNSTDRAAVEAYLKAKWATP